MENTITKTKRLLILFLAFACFATIAQTNTTEKTKQQKQDEGGKKKMCDDVMKRAPYIFEGKLISTTNFTTTTGEIYSSAIIEVQEVIKGSIKKGTVEINYFRARIDENGDKVVFQSSSPTIVEPTIPEGLGIYFCYDDKSAPNNPSIKRTNVNPIKILDAASISNDKIKGGGMGKYFTSVTAFYKYLNDNYNLAIDKALLEKKSLNDNLYNERIKLYQKKRNEKQKNNSSVNRTGTGCSDLLISEQLDGSGSNNSVEVYNPTSSPISLSNYKLLIYHNASLTPTAIPLTGTISAYGTHVVVQQGASSALLAHANQTTNNLNFNGDVVTALNKGNAHIDIIGEIGVANAAGNWTLTPSGGTNNSDIRRNYTIGQGDTVWSSSKSQWTAFNMDSISNFGHHSNICSVDPDLHLSIVNGADSSGYFTFDVTGYSIGSPYTWFDGGSIHILYNTSVFGDSIYTNGGVHISNYSSFPSSIYVPYPGDAGYDTLRIYFATDPSLSNPSRTQLTSTPTKLYHVRMKVLHCGINAVIDTTNDFEASGLSYFTNNQTDNWTIAVPYDNTIYNGSFNTPIACTGITITDFTQPINAGVGDILTITGTGFGNTRDNGQVKFKNADNGGATYLSKLNAIDYVVGGWTDTQIQIKLPSFVDSILPFPKQAVKYFLGGGNFIVKNNAGDSAVSGLNSNGTGVPFSIYYNLRQDWSANDDKKFEVDLRNDNGIGGYTLRLNPTDFPPNSNRRGIFTKAMHDWICMTGVNLIIGADTTINYVPNTTDGINYIFFTSDTNVTNASTNAQTILADVICGSNTAVILKEADMGFNTNKIFFLDSTDTQPVPSGQIDFYGVCLHEIGHIVELAHHTDPNNLMYFAGNTGPITAVNRKRLVMGSSPADGGTYSVGQSTSNSVICGGVTVMIAENSSSCIMGINKYLANNYFLNLYPNPTNGSSVNIDFQAPTNTEAQIVVYDMMGRAVYSNNLGKRNDINSTYSLDVSNLSSGMYMVNLVIDKVKVCQKFIKQ